MAKAKIQPESESEFELQPHPQPLKKNLNWIYTVLSITGLLLMALFIVLKNPKIKFEMGVIEITRPELLMLISAMGILIAVLGTIAYPNADTSGKRKTAMGIVIISSAIVITALLLML
jgi:uncharacterized membrane protein YidH (DUF202 family)